MAKYRKKPVVIEAFQFPRLDSHEDSYDAFMEWAADVGFDIRTQQDGGLRIDTLEGQMTAQPGDWIIKGVKGASSTPASPTSSLRRTNASRSQNGEGASRSTGSCRQGGQFLRYQQPHCGAA